MEQLKALKDIFQSGFITNEEYSQRLRQIVDSITGTNIKSPQKSDILRSPEPSKRKSATHTTEKNKNRHQATEIKRRCRYPQNEITKTNMEADFSGNIRR